jgi:hypothetical protein
MKVRCNLCKRELEIDKTEFDTIYVYPCGCILANPVSKYSRYNNMTEQEWRDELSRCINNIINKIRSHNVDE